MQKFIVIVVFIVFVGGMVLILVFSFCVVILICIKVLEIVVKQKNDFYKEGVEGFSKFDCFGLVYFVYFKVGYKWLLCFIVQGQYN